MIPEASRPAAAVAVLAALAALGVPASAQNKPIFIEMPAGFAVTDINATGQVVTGAQGGQNVYWTQEGGVVQLGGAGLDLVSVSADGTKISGGTPGDGGNSAGIWLGGTSWQAFGPLPPATQGCPDLSNNYDMSADGSVVVGLGWNVCQARAFRWTESTGMVDLGTLVANRSTRANGVSGDGSVIVGWQDLATGQRVGAKWVNGAEEYVLASGGAHVGEAQHANHDGSMIVGIACNEAGKSWVWTQAAGLQCLSGMNNAWNLSDDGSIIVGSQGSGPTMQARISFDGADAIDLKAWLTSQGVAAPGTWIVLNSPLAIASDGSVLGGWGQKDQPWPATRNFLVVLTLAPPNLTLAKGLGGTDLNWSRVTGGARSDVIRGTLSVLLASGGDFSLATDTCLANTTGLTTLTDPIDPPANDGSWYLVRAENGTTKGTYDSNGPGQVGSRDNGILSSGVACP